MLLGSSLLFEISAYYFSLKWMEGVVNHELGILRSSKILKIVLIV